MPGSQAPQYKVGRVVRSSYATSAFGRVIILMAMNRRSVLVGLGAITVGGGAAFGAGAFSSVSADRTANFQVTNDGTAYLGLSGDGNYVTETDTGTGGASIIEFQFGSLNDNAESRFNGALTITNNSADGNAKDVYVQDDGTVTSGGVIDFVDPSNADASVVGSANAVNIANGGSLTLDVIIDTNAGDPSTVSTVTVAGQ